MILIQRRLLMFFSYDSNTYKLLALLSRMPEVSRGELMMAKK